MNANITTFLTSTEFIVAVLVVSTVLLVVLYMFFEKASSKRKAKDLEGDD